MDRKLKKLCEKLLEYWHNEEIVFNTLSLSKTVEIETLIKKITELVEK
jgi:hypothetical protein